MTHQEMEIRIKELEKQVKALEQEPCEDAISRRAVEKITWEEPSYSDALNVLTEVRDKVRALPPVNPQYTADEIQKMQDLEQAELEKAYELGKCEGQNSEDAISRQAVLDAIENEYKGEASELLAHEIVNIMAIIDDVPPVNPQPKTGHWIFDEILDRNYYCSECKSMGVDYWDYCPYCGARMVEPQESKETETWNGIHAQITAPKGTFERIFNEADEDTDI